jgi:hypothetical protein
MASGSRVKPSNGDLRRQKSEAADIITLKTIYNYYTDWW